MIVKVVGIEKQDFKFDDGTRYSGNKIHAIESDYTSDGLSGQRVVVLKVSDKSRFADFPFVLGQEYSVFFSLKGALDYVALHQAAKDPAEYVDRL